MQLIGEFKPDTFCEICAKTVQFCARLMQKCAEKCKKSPFSSSLFFLTSDQLKSARARLLRAFALAMTKKTSD